MKNNIKNNNLADINLISKEKSKGKLSGVDGLRCIACLAVITHHLSQRLGVDGEPKSLHYFALMGNTGVSIFFILSGFLLSYPFWNSYLKNDDFPKVKEYILRRGARIIPGFYIALIASTLLVMILKIPTEHLWTRFIAALTFTSCFHYVTLFPSDINGALWSISFEVFCYILFIVMTSCKFDFKNFGIWFSVSIGIVIASYIIATLSYKFIEKPILD